MSASELSQDTIKRLHSAGRDVPKGEEAGPRPGGVTVRDAFRRFAGRTATMSGSPWTFLAAVIFLVVWACSYPLFKQFHDPFNTWQLVVNTVTTIVTFLMVFLIQNTQNRDAKALHLKLDELIRSKKGARNWLVELENCDDEELEALKSEFERIRREALGQKKGAAGRGIAGVEEEEKHRAGDA